MATTITRGSTCRIKSSPLGGLKISDLGAPQIYISQDLSFISKDATVSDDGSYIYCDLTESETLELVDGVETRIQVVYVNDAENKVYRMPIHIATVLPTLVEEV